MATMLDSLVVGQTPDFTSISQIERGSSNMFWFCVVVLLASCYAVFERTVVSFPAT